MTNLIAEVLAYRTDQWPYRRDWHPYVDPWDFEQIKIVQLDDHSFIETTTHSNSRKAFLKIDERPL